MDPGTSSPPTPLADPSRLSNDSKVPNFSIWRHVVFGSLIMSLLLFGIGGWAASATLSGAVIASATIVVDRHVKKVQHRDGGIVSEINVKDGDHVNGGQVLLRLDATQTRAELSIIRSQLTEITARSARLGAESEGRTTLKLPPDFIMLGEEAQRAADGELRLFEHNKANNQS